MDCKTFLKTTIETFSQCQDKTCKTSANTCEEESPKGGFNWAANFPGEGGGCRLTKDKDKPEDRQGAVYKIKCCDCQASYIGETGRNLSTRLTEHKRATRNGDVNNHIAEHHLKMKHQIDWDSAICITYSTDYYQRLTLESGFTTKLRTNVTNIHTCLFKLI